MDQGAGPERVAQRVARTAATIDHLDARISAWLTGRSDDDRFSRFTHHFDVLETVLFRMLTAVCSALREAASGRDAAAVYERCRTLEQSVLHVQRTFERYADKYDQRLDPGRAAALLAADEVVLSCWSEPFAALRRQPPTGPLSYLDARFDAFATPRVSPPPDLRAPGDAIVAEHVRALPIPTIALPELAERDPWWLVLAAHETGHHVQKDLQPALEADTRAALTAVTGELAEHWSGWALEAFADAYSVLMVGSTAAWAIDELQFAAPIKLVTAPRPGDRYPPPLVRLALLGELARHSGAVAAVTPPSASEARAWLAALPDGAVPPRARDVVDQHLAVTPQVAAALVELPVAGSPLRAISGLQPGWFAGSGRVSTWSRQLSSAAPVLAPVQVRPAARLAVAAAVARYQELSADPRPDMNADLDRLRTNVLRILPTCGEPGVFAPAPAPDVTALADELASRLVGAAPDGGDT
jgi:hypothetical protein